MVKTTHDFQDREDRHLLLNALLHMVRVEIISDSLLLQVGKAGEGRGRACLLYTSAAADE